MVDRTPLRYLLDENGNPAGLTEFRAGDQLPVSILANALALVLGEIEASSSSAIAPGDSIAQAFAKLQAQVGAAQAALDGKQSALVSGENIKTVGGQSLLGSGDIGVGGTEIGDIAITHRTLSAPEWLPADGSVYLQSEYPELFDVVGLKYSGENDIAWTFCEAVIGFPVATAVYEGGLFVAGGEYFTDPNQPRQTGLATSIDGETWTVVNLPDAFGEVREVAYGNGTYVAVTFVYDPNDDYKPSHIITSSDGIVWTSQEWPVESGILTSVAYGNGKFVAVGTDGAITSSDGYAWGSSAYDMGDAAEEDVRIAYGNGVFVAVSSSGKAVSSDGIIWENAWAWLRGVGYGKPRSFVFKGGMFLLATEDAQIITSLDGYNWQVRFHGNGDMYPSSLSYGNGLYLCQFAGTFYSSQDGVTWAISHGALANDEPEGLMFALGKFYTFPWEGNGVLIGNYAYDTSTQFAAPRIHAPGANVYYKAK